MSGVEAIVPFSLTVMTDAAEAAALPATSPDEEPSRLRFRAASLAAGLVLALVAVRLQAQLWDVTTPLGSLEALWWLLVVGAAFAVLMDATFGPRSIAPPPPHPDETAAPLSARPSLLLPRPSSLVPRPSPFTAALVAEVVSLGLFRLGWQYDLALAAHLVACASFLIALWRAAGVRPRAVLPGWSASTPSRSPSCCRSPYSPGCGRPPSSPRASGSTSRSAASKCFGCSPSASTDRSSHGILQEPTGLWYLMLPLVAGSAATRSRCACRPSSSAPSASAPSTSWPATCTPADRRRRRRPRGRLLLASDLQPDRPAGHPLAHLRHRRRRAAAARPAIRQPLPPGKCRRRRRGRPLLLLHQPGDAARPGRHRRPPAPRREARLPAPQPRRPGLLRRRLHPRRRADDPARRHRSEPPHRPHQHRQRLPGGRDGRQLAAADRQSNGDRLRFLVRLVLLLAAHFGDSPSRMAPRYRRIRCQT